MSLSAEAERALRDSNSWWEPPHHVRPVPPDYERPQVAVLWAALSRLGARTQILRGPRQVGKSTAMLQLVRRLILSGKSPVDIIFVRCDLDILRGSLTLLAVLN